jgi:hypothetical protein
MKLYIVKNGYIGEGEIYTIVIAENEVRAIEIAYKKFKEESDKYNKPEEYYTDLTIELLCDDTSKEYASEVSD